VRIAAVSWLRLVWWDWQGRRSFLCADVATTLTAAGSKGGESERRFSGLSTTARKRDALPAPHTADSDTEANAFRLQRTEKR
jgi:hypothetical protein